MARICRHLAGMPLGIELVAAAVNVMSAEIAAELESSLDVLSATTRHMPDRHRTVRAAFEPSWRRISSMEKGGFGRAAAEEVAGATRSTLSALADRSFLRYDQTTRCFQMHELLRQFGEENLSEEKTLKRNVRDQQSAYHAAAFSSKPAAWREYRPCMLGYFGSRAGPTASGLSASLYCATDDP